VAGMYWMPALVSGLVLRSPPVRRRTDACARVELIPGGRREDAESWLNKRLASVFRRLMFWAWCVEDTGTDRRDARLSVLGYACGRALNVGLVTGSTNACQPSCRPDEDRAPRPAQSGDNHAACLAVFVPAPSIAYINRHLAGGSRIRCAWPCYRGWDLPVAPRRRPQDRPAAWADRELFNPPRLALRGRRDWQRPPPPGESSELPRGHGDAPRNVADNLQVAHVVG